MEKEKLMEMIEQVENELFCLDLIDRWTIEDKKQANKLYKELAQLKKHLAEIKVKTLKK